MKPADEALAAALAGVTIRAAARAGLVERRCPAAHRPRRDPRAAGAAGAAAGAVGADDAQPAGGRLSTGSTRSARGRVLAGLLKRVQRKVDCQNISA